MLIAEGGRWPALEGFHRRPRLGSSGVAAVTAAAADRPPLPSLAVQRSERKTDGSDCRSQSFREFRCQPPVSPVPCRRQCGRFFGADEVTATVHCETLFLLLLLIIEDAKRRSKRRPWNQQYGTHVQEEAHPIELLAAEIQRTVRVSCVRFVFLIKKISKTDQTLPSALIQVN